MRRVLIAFGCLAAALGAENGAAARDYPWCAYVGIGFEGTNCGFDSYRQCMEDVSGIGGYCQPNNIIKPPAPPRRHRLGRS